jgi:hypothetical protein
LMMKLTYSAPNSSFPRESTWKLWLWFLLICANGHVLVQMEMSCVCVLKHIFKLQKQGRTWDKILGTSDINQAHNIHLSWWKVTRIMSIINPILSPSKDWRASKSEVMQRMFISVHKFVRFTNPMWRMEFWAICEMFPSSDCRGDIPQILS